MITRFESKGIMGIPDMNISLDDEKIILIQGPNGSGKSSLLKQITHPLSSVSRSVKLKNGVSEGLVKLEIYYNNKYYLVHHEFTRASKGNVTTISHLYKKNENNVYENLTETGLQNDFKKQVSTYLDYEDYLYSILNIGVENKGIIDMTNTNRLEYLKKIFNMEALTIIKENTLNKFNDSNGKIKFINTKLNDFPTLEEIYSKFNNYKNLIELNKVNIKNKEEELNVYRKSQVDESILSELKSKLDAYYKEITDLTELKKVVSEYSFSYEIEKLKENLIRSETLLSNKEENLLEIKDKLNKIDKTDKNSLELECKRIEEKINIFYNKNKDKKYFSSDPSHKGNLETSKENLEDIRYQKELSKNLPYTYSDIFLYYQDDNINKKERELKEVIHSLENLLILKEEELSNLDVSRNLTKHDIHTDCSNPNCPNLPLRIEYNKQIENLNFYKILNDEIRKIKMDIQSNREEYESFSVLADIIIEIKRLSKRIFIPVNIKDILHQDYHIDELIEALSDNIFYLDDMNTIIKYEEELKNKIILFNSLKEKSDNLEEELNKSFSILVNEISELKENIKNIKNNLNKYLSLDISDSLKNKKKSEYDTIIRLTNGMIEDLKERISQYEFSNNSIENINTMLASLYKEQDNLREEYINIKSSLLQIKSLNKELEEELKSNELLKLIKQIVSLELPSRLFEGYLFDISRKVNDLLDGFMTIRFDVTNGVDIYCNREGIERFSNDLSQGEKSMLSIALMIAFKMNIQWDVISIDEGDATLDEANRDRFIYMVRDYSESISTIKQIFLVSHGYQNTEGLDVKIIQL